MNYFKLIGIGISITILAGCQGSLALLDGYSSDSSQLIVDTNNSKYKRVIIDSYLKSENKDRLKHKVGITSHHLPVAAEFIGEFYEEFLEGYAKEEENVFIVIGPDHPEKCTENVTTGLVSYKTNFGLLETNTEIVNKMAESEYINLESNCLEGEHSIGVQADYIKMIDAEANIVPLILSSSTDEVQLDEVLSVLKEFYEEARFVISVDFNHYRDVAQSKGFDTQTIKAIELMSAKDIQVDHVDSPPSLRLGLELAKMGGYDQPNIFGYANSYDFTGQYSNTTSYLNVIFEKEKSDH